MRALFRDYGSGGETKLDPGAMRTFTFHVSPSAAATNAIATDVLLASDNSPTGGTVQSSSSNRAPDVYGPHGANELFVKGPGNSLRQMQRQGPPVSGPESTKGIVMIDGVPNVVIRG